MSLASVKHRTYVVAKLDSVVRHEVGERSRESPESQVAFRNAVEELEHLGDAELEQTEGVVAQEGNDLWELTRGLALLDEHDFYLQIERGNLLAPS